MAGTLSLNFSGSEASFAVGAKSVWLITHDEGLNNRVLTQVDVANLTVTKKIPLPFAGAGVTFELGHVWITSPDANQLMKVDLDSGSVSSFVTESGPRFVTSGEGHVWTLNQSAGSVQKFNAETGALEATVAAGLAGGGGDIDFGEGAIWVTMPGKPVTKIDKDLNVVLLSFVGSGLGDAIRAGYGSVWVSGSNIHRIAAP